ncbi:hypothetical protein GmHk_04G010598 [Glycine max]|nr:hypothetical protein GmHk_04G010598 [Glycine max]
MITKDDDKGDDKKLKDQSKNNSSESKINQRTTQNQEEFKTQEESLESRFKVQDLKNQDHDSRLKIQESREGLIKIRYILCGTSRGYIYLGLTENKRGYISCGSVLVEGTSTRISKRTREAPLELVGLGSSSSMDSFASWKMNGSGMEKEEREETPLQGEDESKRSSPP